MRLIVAALNTVIELNCRTQWSLYAQLSLSQNVTPDYPRSIVVGSWVDFSSRVSDRSYKQPKIIAQSYVIINNHIFLAK